MRGSCLQSGEGTLLPCGSSGFWFHLGLWPSPVGAWWWGWGAPWSWGTDVLLTGRSGGTGAPGQGMWSCLDAGTSEQQKLLEDARACGHNFVPLRDSPSGSSREEPIDPSVFPRTVDVAQPVHVLTGCWPWLGSCPPTCAVTGALATGFCVRFSPCGTCRRSEVRKGEVGVSVPQRHWPGCVPAWATSPPTPVGWGIAVPAALSPPLWEEPLPHSVVLTGPSAPPEERLGGFLHPRWALTGTKAQDLRERDGCSSHWQHPVSG